MAADPSDPFDLARFVAAQEPVLDQVRAELAAGRKQSHWMWFVFPQLRGLGQSAMARHYGLAGLAEAAAYLAHPLLGPRLLDCTGLVNRVEGRSAHAVFGSPDDMKFRSCMTLFAAARPAEPAFGDALRRYCDGQPDPRTLALLREDAARG
ncbi:DUF1810 domain-containing protein [Roseicella frigidaeris]|uniref:DUF1810 domain-containing protein n=1 Tax=Roseicella frigidaeris TaxID=2230885 RepID=A0A327ME23_9PROT|nr:DUF1810 domain-containing protein [Roseicella frigidaeris]RAI60917.1 DUF1810 domain-containing protein [Roseicella frigidaeris]